MSSWAAGSAADPPMPELWTDGRRLHYQEWGPPDGPAVLLLHGLTGRAAVWEPVARRLAAVGFRTVACDLRGHGASDRAADYRLTGYVEDTIAVIERLGLAPAHPIGDSLGGTIAWEAGARPALARCLVIEDQHPEADPAAPAVWQEWARGWPWRFASRAEGLAFLEATGRSLAWWAPSLIPLPDGGWGWAFDRTAVVETARHLWSQAAWDRLARVPVPTLLLRGEQSQHLTAETAARMAAIIPRCRLVTVPGADHWIHRDADRFADLVIPFLQTCAQSG